jgi:hypothetical protein
MHIPPGGPAEPVTLLQHWLSDRDRGHGKRRYVCFGGKDAPRRSHPSSYVLC